MEFDMVAAGLDLLLKTSMCCSAIGTRIEKSFIDKRDDIEGR